MSRPFPSAGPRHDQLREEIVRRIRDGIYPPETQLPSIAALSVDFGVSAITVKRAIRDLQVLGLLRSVPGVAMVVRRQQRFIRDLDLAFGSPDDAKRVGQDVAIRLLSISYERIDDPVLQTLSPPDGPLLHVQRVILADGIPIAHDSAFMTLPMDQDIIDQLRTRFIYEILNDSGLAVESTRLLIDAAPASRAVQDVFSVPSGYPTLRRLYHHVTVNPAVAVYGISAAPFDRLACTIELHPRTPRRRKPRRAQDPS